MAQTSLVYLKFHAPQGTCEAEGDRADEIMCVCWTDKWQ